MGSERTFEEYLKSTIRKVKQTEEIRESESFVMKDISLSGEGFLSLFDTELR